MKSSIFFPFLFVLISCNTSTDNNLTPRIVVSENHRFLATEKGDPFFWLGDTGWLLPSKLSREEAVTYLEDRKQKGFNVVQISILHNLRNVNFYGDSALVGHQIDKPLVTPGKSFNDPKQYDYWDHIDYLIDVAAKKGIYIGIVMVWGGNVKSGQVTVDQVKSYGEWLASRYRNRSNVIWINGGDTRGDDSIAVWNALGTAVRKTTHNQLITYHPFGRTQSSMWFHNEPWLDFNMFQSGHRRYDQDTTGLAYGEDNWKYAAVDYAKIPAKPTLDGEPSYEGVPQGLHDPAQPLWTDKDVRRYAYWSVFAGCCGFTYGHGSIMGMIKSTDRRSSYGPKVPWDVAINAPGASQMQYLKQLMLSKPYFERVPANDLLAEEQGKKYDYIAITRGNDYVFAYTWNGRNISLNLQKMTGSEFKASWFDPRIGTYTAIGTFKNSGVLTFDPPGENEPGNDWVLVLEKI
jgi:hypothetical protein